MLELLFPKNPLLGGKVDDEYIAEGRTAVDLGVKLHLIDLEALDDGNLKRALRDVPEASQTVDLMYRGWMLRADPYQDLYAALLARGYKLVNSPEEYLHCHYLPNSYSIIQKRTPKSIWIPGEVPPPIEFILERLTVFGSRPIVLKASPLNSSEYAFVYIF